MNRSWKFMIYSWLHGLWLVHQDILFMNIFIKCNSWTNDEYAIMLDLYCKNEAHNRIMYCLEAYAVYVLQRFKKCTAQTFLFLFTYPQNYICCYCTVNIVWEDCICTAELVVLHLCWCKLLKNYNSSVPQLVECVCGFLSIGYFLWRQFNELQLLELTMTHYSSTQLILNQINGNVQASIFYFHEKKYLWNK